MLIQNREEFDELLTTVAKSSHLAIDTETFKSDNWSRRKLMGVAIYAPVGEGKEGRSYYLPIGHPILPIFKDKNCPSEWLNELEPYLKDEDKLWAFHNASFDLNIFQDYGIEVASIFDTMIAAHLLNENRFDYSLDSLGRDLFGLNKMKLGPTEKLLDKLRKGEEPDINGWEKLPPFIMADYAETDVKITYLLMERFLPKLRAQKLWEVWEESRQYIRTLQHIARNGILIDREKLRTLADSSRTRMQDILQELGHEVTPSQIARTLHESPPVGHGLAVRFRSPKTSKPKVDEPSLESYALTSPEVKPFVENVLEFRGLQKATSTWFEGFERFLDDEGRIHPGYKQHGTVTGRLSCAAPNLQQLPRKGSVRGLFIPPDENYELWEFDYSQIEFRLTVAYAECETLAEIIRNGGDTHMMTAELIGAVEKLGPKDGRQIGKTSNFLLIYGGGAAKLQSTIWRDTKLVVSIEDCLKWVNEFHSAYPEFRRFAKRAENTARKQGFVKMWNGRLRRLPREIAWQAINGVIQGGASQVMMRALNRIYLDDRIQSKMVSTVHDSVWMEMHKDRVAVETPLIKDLMGNEPTEIFGLPISVDTKLVG